MKLDLSLTFGFKLFTVLFAIGLIGAVLVACRVEFFSMVSSSW
jgi:hypothetical protein